MDPQSEPSQRRYYKNLDIAEIKRLYVEEKQSVRQVASHFGVGAQTISRRLTDAGVDLRPSNNPGGARGQSFDAEEAKRLYVDEQMTMRDVAEQLGVGAAIVRKHLKDAGVPIRHRGGARPKAIDIEEAKRLYVEEGLSTTEIAPYFGVNQATVHRRLVEAGVPIRGFDEAAASRNARVRSPGDLEGLAEALDLETGQLKELLVKYGFLGGKN